MSWDIFPKDKIEYFLDKLKDIFDTKADSGEVEGLKTVTGNPITLTDASETYAQGLTVELEPKQDLHGYDFPWVGGAGVNIFDKDSAVNGFWQSNGTYSISADYKTIYCKVTPNTTYAVSGISGWDNWRLCYFNTENPATFTRRNINVSDTFTTDSDTILISFSPDTVGYDGGDGVQVEKGNQSTPFKPYSNICPITGYDECEVDDVGFNLISQVYDDKYINHTNGAMQGATGFHCTDYIHLYANETYYFKDAHMSGNQWGAIYTLSDKTFISAFDLAANTEFTAPAYDCYFRITIANAESCINVSDASKNGTFAPYHSSNATIKFGQTLYGGVSDFVEGGTESTYAVTTIAEMAAGSHITRETASGRVRYVITIAGMKKQTVRTMADLYSEQYVTISDGRSYSNCPDYCIFNRPEGGVFINDQRYESVSDFVAANGDIKICYPLETANTLSTPPTDLKLLQGTNNLTTNGTTITLDYIPNNSIGDAVKASEEYTDRVVERVIPKAKLLGFYEIYDESGTLYDVTIPTATDANFILFEYRIQSRVGSTLIPSKSSYNNYISVEVNNGVNQNWVEFLYNSTYHTLTYASNVTTGFGVLSIYAF